METKFKIGDRVRLTRDNAVLAWHEIKAGATGTVEEAVNSRMVGVKFDNHCPLGYLWAYTDAVELLEVDKPFKVGDRIVVVEGDLKGERGSVLNECGVEGCFIVGLDGFGFDSHLDKSEIRLDTKMAEAFANAERIESPTEDAKLDQGEDAAAGPEIKLGDKVIHELDGEEIGEVVRVHEDRRTCDVKLPEWYGGTTAHDEEMSMLTIVREEEAAAEPVPTAEPAPSNEPKALITVKITKDDIAIRISEESCIDNPGDLARVVILLERLRDKLAG